MRAAEIEKGEDYAYCTKRDTDDIIGDRVRIVDASPIYGETFARSGERGHKIVSKVDGLSPGHMLHGHERCNRILVELLRNDGETPNPVHRMAVLSQHIINPWEVQVDHVARCRKAKRKQWDKEQKRRNAERGARDSIAKRLEALGITDTSRYGRDDSRTAALLIVDMERLLDLAEGKKT